MRGLTLWQPMAWAVAEGHKPVENRVWPLPRPLMGEHFAVHAGKKYDAAWAAMIRDEFGLDVPPREQLALGAVVAVATFVACVDERECAALTPGALYPMGVSAPLEAVRRWFSGPYGFLLGNVRKLSEPIPCRGFQGLWTLPPQIEALVIDQVGNASPEGSVPSMDEVRARFRKIIGAHGKFTPRDLVCVADEFNMSPESMCRLLEDLELLAARTFDDLVGPSGVLEPGAPQPVQENLFDPDPASD